MITKSPEATSTGPTALMTSVFDALEAAQIPHAVMHSHDFGSNIAVERRGHHGS